MLFNSFSFLIYFPIVFVSYFSLPKRFRIPFLLLSSCVFYMAFVPKYILILFFLITVDFFAAQAIEKREGIERKRFLQLSIFANIGTLFVFKYFNFFNLNIAALAGFLHWNYSPLLLTIILPLGLSFHVFQSLSYVIEVYRKKYTPEKNYLTYALYVMFFPQLVAGPIERPQNLLPQFHAIREFDPVNARKGLERMLWGFFKKLVIADQIATIINPIFKDIPNNGPALLFVMFLFSYQLYCDFSGYSDIAIGSAQVLGFCLTENFNRPYASTSISEFWRRWHISLSNWLRDYLYYPLIFSVKEKTKWTMYWATIITFVLIGLWHGANWTFVVMGALHGFYIVFGSVTEKYRQKISEYVGLTKVPKLRHTLQVFIIFWLASFSFVFFRAESVGQAWQIISHLGDRLLNVRGAIASLKGFGFGGTQHLVVYMMIVFMEIVQYFQAQKNKFFLFDDKPKALRYAWYYVLILVILFYGYFGETAFIYFQF
ncbi:MAG: MBOAT family protein [Candidatus Parcubacteria bacterium]|nr:MBOAT family protein [Candidatus Parcubacteria bacterium]